MRSSVFDKGGRFGQVTDWMMKVSAAPSHGVLESGPEGPP